jgi:hypothetical protein
MPAALIQLKTCRHVFEAEQGSMDDTIEQSPGSSNVTSVTFQRPDKRPLPFNPLLAFH